MTKVYKTTSRLILALLLAAGLTAHGQSFQVSGVVKDARSSEEMVGVNVSVKGTSQGTITDVSGKFSLDINKADAVLVFSFIGYRSKEMAVSSSVTTLEVTLEEDVTSLEEVVVSGLASSVKRSNLGNAIVSVSAKDLTGTTQIQTTDGALYGKVTGANIRSNGGAPGGGMSIQLRGLSSIQGSAQPLIIVDGVYIDNSFQRTGRATVSGAGASTQDDGSNRLADLNPADIEHIEILKGPSAAAIYGTRANAGVVIITTKKGQSGKTVVSFNQDIGVGSALRLLGVDGWSVEKINAFPGFSAAAKPVEIGRFNAAAGAVYDYEDYFYGNTATLSNTRISARGGDDKTTFFLSGSLTDEEGVVKKTGFKRYSIRANIDHKLTKDIKISFNTNVMRSLTDRGFTGNQNNTGASIGYSIAYVPSYFSLFPNEMGVYPDNPYTVRENPVAVTDKGINNSTVNRFIQAFALDANLLKTDNSILKFRLNGGLDFLQNSTMIYLPEDLQFQRGQANPGDLLVGKQETLNTNFQAALVYDYQVGAVGMSTQAGMVRLDFQSDAIFTRGRGLNPGQINIKQANLQEVESDVFTKQQDVGVFIQQDMNYQDKIIGNIGIRWDKSTTNGDKDKYYSFPRASLAVNIANFDFWSVKAINQLKPRIAYGQTAGAVPFGSTFSRLDAVYIGGLPGNAVNPVVGNLLITPERAEEIEFGLDAAFLNNRISLEATYYIKNTKDNIQNLNLAPGTGFTTSPSNEAELQNKGLELALSANVLQKDKIRWTTRLMWWKNETMTTRLGIPSYTIGGFGSALGTFLVRQGVSPTSIVGTPAISPGEFTVWGNSQPDFTMSWVNNVTFLKNFELSFMWEWREGGANINLQNYLTDGGGTTNGYYKNMSSAPTNAGTWVQDATFIKLREVGLYYNVPKASTDKWFKNALSKARIGVSGNNLLLITDYVGYDPETSTFGAAALANNVDIAPYPTMRRLFFHVQIDF